MTKTVEQVVEEMKSDATLYVKSDDKNYEASGALLDYAESILSAHNRQMAEALAEPTMEEREAASECEGWVSPDHILESRRKQRGLA